jgi:hypothetical protein
MWSKLLKATAVASVGAAFASIVGATLLLHGALTCFAPRRARRPKRAGT